MGLIRAAVGAVGGTMADQWKEFFYCEAMDKEVMVVKWTKRSSSRSSNKHGSDNVISSGSGIAVADGQCMMIVEQGKVDDIFYRTGHPYTMGLLASIPGLTKDKSERLQSIPGSPPDMTKPPKGCPFASRCQFARNICAAECPPFVQVGSRQARCWLLQPDAPAEGNPLHEKLAEAERKAH